MSCRATVRMKQRKEQKKREMEEAALRGRVEDVKVEKVVEVKPSIDSVDSGTVTEINVVDQDYSTYTKKDLESKLKVELVDIVKRMGHDTGGTKAELIDKILNFK